MFKISCVNSFNLNSFNSMVISCIKYLWCIIWKLKRWCLYDFTKTTPSKVSLGVWSMSSQCIFSPSRSLEGYGPQCHKPLTWWWEQFSISYGMSSVAGWLRWLPEACLLWCCYPLYPPSQLWCTGWIFAACPLLEGSAALHQSAGHCGRAETEIDVRKVWKMLTFWHHVGFL